MDSINEISEDKIDLFADYISIKRNLRISERARKMLRISNFNIKEHKTKDLQKFIEENQETLAKHAPKGWKYLGTYFYVMGFGPYQLAIIWEITDYADLDTLRNHEDSIFWDLIEKKFSYLTNEPTAGWLLRKVGDTKISEAKEE